jgi:hypothetical protein
MHAGYVVLIGICLGVSLIPQVQAIPMAGDALVGVVAWAWGKAGFKPSQALLEKILKSMSPAEVVRLTNSPPPMPPVVETTTAAQTGQIAK